MLALKKEKTGESEGQEAMSHEPSEALAKEPRTTDNRTICTGRPVDSSRAVSRVAFFLSVLTIIIAGVVLLVVYKPRRRSHKELWLGCNTPQCADALFYLDSMGDPNADPCQDFYSHVCSKWHNHRDGESFLKDALRNFLTKLHLRLRHQQTVTTSDHLSGTMEAMSSLYRCCHEFLAGNVSIETKGDLIERTFNTPEILQSSSLAEAFRSFLQLSLTHGIASTVELRFRKSPSKVFLHVLWRGSVREKLDVETHVEVVENYIAEVARKLDHNATAEEILRLDRDIGSLSAEEVKIEIRPFFSLEDTSASFETGLWKKAINNVTPGLTTLEDEDPVVTMGYRHIKSSMDILLSVPLPVVRAYLSLQVLMNVWSFDYIKRHRIRSSSDTIRTCLGATKSAMKAHWLSFVYSATAGGVGSPRDVRNIFEKIMQYHFNTTPSWTDRNTAMESKILLERIVLRLYQEENESRAPDMPALRDVEDDFVVKYLSFLTWTRRYFTQFPPSTILDDQQDSELSENSVYSKKFASVFIPAFLQQKPVLYPSIVAPYFNYGTLGSLIAAGVSEAIGPRLQSTKTFGRHKYAWSPSVWKEFHVASSCYRPFFARAQLQDSQPLNLTLTQKNSLFVWSRGARVAYDAAMNELTAALANLTMARQIFFKRFCLLSCDAVDVNTAREQCMVPLMNMREFAAAFRCNANSIMNPREKCPVL